MVDATEPDAGDATDRPEPGEGRRSSARTLDRRTIAICVVIGLIAAIGTALVLSLVTSDDDAGDPGKMALEEPGAVDSARLLGQPLDTPDGGTTKLRAYLDEQPLLVNLWAHNCEPCGAEMPLLQQAADDNPEITFVGVATQDDPDKAAEFAKDKISYDWALDPTGEFFYEARGAGMPTTLLLGADGEVVASHTGAFSDAAQLQTFLDKAS